MTATATRAGKVTVKRGRPASPFTCEVLAVLSESVTADHERLTEACEAAGLNPREVQVVLAIEVGELTQAEVAEVLRVSRQYIGKLAAAATAKLCDDGRRVSLGRVSHYEVVHYGDFATLDLMMYGGNGKRHNWGAGPD